MMSTVSTRNNKPYCERVDVPGYECIDREVDNRALYFAGDCCQCLYFIYSKEGRDYIVTFEFLVIIPATGDCVPVADYSTCIYFENTKLYQGGDWFQPQQRQDEINRSIVNTRHRVEISNNSQSMKVFDINAKATNDSFFTENNDLLMYSFESSDSQNTVSGLYAFSPDSRCFAYIFAWEDANEREYPEVLIVFLTSYRDYHWQRRSHFMLFLAGYGLLKVFQQRKENHDEVVPVPRLIEEHKDESVTGRLFFRVLYCANLLQHIVSYL